jgi:hypothetical protein
MKKVCFRSLFLSLVLASVAAGFVGCGKDEKEVAQVKRDQTANSRAARTAVMITLTHSRYSGDEGVKIGRSSKDQPAYVVSINASNITSIVPKTDPEDPFFKSYPDARCLVGGNYYVTENREEVLQLIEKATHPDSSK